ncbi:endospore germination permease [Paenibacillus sp. N1-5-1-14]|uniref:GerAB/ArcD/ProY family transporter n=1 Tax=Paenibacillus radicibacter TaxID=2972488 RepID=UPI0021590014|nr:endospore germination permease [Paenibacillus radicibacter]MCR8643500.1 endospore germination permease [Paenibacillus radicibacter]
MRGANHQISSFQAICIILISAGLLNHVIVLPLVLKMAGRDGWMSVIIALLACLLWIPLVYGTMKRKGNMHFFEWLHSKLGTILSWIVVGIICIYIFSVAWITVKDTTEWIGIIYLPTTPNFVISLLLIILCCLCALMGIRSIAISAGVLLPIVILLGYFVMSANFEYKDYSMMLPMLENGYAPIVKGAVFISGGLVEIIMLLFMQHRIHTSLRMRSLVILVVLLAGLTVGPLMGSIASFGPFESALQRYPAFEQWRLVKIGKSIEHIDFLSLYQWIAGTFIRVSLALFLIYDLLPFSNSNVRKGVCIGTSLLLLLLVSMHFSDTRFIQILAGWYYPLIVPLIVVISIGLWMTARIKKKTMQERTR